MLEGYNDQKNPAAGLDIQYSTLDPEPPALIALDRTARLIATTVVSVVTTVIATLVISLALVLIPSLVLLLLLVCLVLLVVFVLVLCKVCSDSANNSSCDGSEGSSISGLVGEESSSSTTS